MNASALDQDWVRSQFPQLSDDPGFVFCANAGGSFVALPVIELMEHYNRHTRVQPYSAFGPSEEAGRAMDRARQCWAQALNLDTAELTIGPSTSINTYVFANACGEAWGPGDEIVVCQQDHESNVGVWRNKAKARGATVREWPVDPVTGLLDPEDLYPLLNDNTRWVFFTHCSNIIGTVNPVADIVAGIRQRCPARVGVDAVAYAPHHLPDIHALGVDAYFFSLYKVFGPHQGIMAVRADLHPELQPQSHYFLKTDTHKWLNPAGPPARPGRRLRRGHRLLLGPAPTSRRAPRTRRCRSRWTPCTSCWRRTSPPWRSRCWRSSMRVATSACWASPAPLGATGGQRSHSSPWVGPPRRSPQPCRRRGIGTEAGHFYAQRLLSALDIAPDAGVVRLSLVHYNTPADAERILAALERALAP